MVFDVVFASVWPVNWLYFLLLYRCCWYGYFSGQSRSGSDVLSMLRSMCQLISFPSEIPSKDPPIVERALCIQPQLPGKLSSVELRGLSANMLSSGRST